MVQEGEEIPTLGHVLVTGGSGFLGNHIVSLLASRKACKKISVLDLKQPANPIAGVDYQNGDLTDYEAMLSLFKKTKPDAVVHTAGPIHSNKNKELMYKVNVDGTKNLLRVAQETGVRSFVYTSSASVIHDAKSDLINANEEYPLVMGKNQPEYYTVTKAQAEIEVLKANRPASNPKFLTAALRPSAMFGEGDVQLLPPGLSAYYRGQTKVQIGANDNLFDFTEITNVAHAHHLCLAALLVTSQREDKGGHRTESRGRRSAKASELPLRGRLRSLHAVRVHRFQDGREVMVPMTVFHGLHRTKRRSHDTNEYASPRPGIMGKM